MFIEIKKEEGITPVKVEKNFKTQRDSAEGFTPEVALKFLEITNHYANIKKIATYISELPTKEERLAYKEFVLSAVHGRNTSPETFEILFNLALEGGYGKELLSTFSKEKIYEEKDIGVSAFIEGVTNKGNEKAYRHVDLSGYDIFIGRLNDNQSKAFIIDESVWSRYINYPKRCVFKHSKKVLFDNSTDYSMIEKLSFEDVEEVVFASVKKMPKNIDVSDVEKVDLSWCDISSCEDLKFKDGAKVIFSRGTKFPKVLDLSSLDEVNLSECDLTGVEEIKFKEGSKVKLDRVKGLPKDIDFTLFSEISLVGCDLKDFDSIQFRDGAKVDLSHVKNAPKGINLSKISSVELYGSDVDAGVDFSSLDEVDLSGQDLSNWDNMIFKEGAKVNLRGAKNFPKVLDLSKVCVEHLERCDFEGVEEIKFGKSKRIELGEAKNLPSVLDFSEVEEVSLTCCDLSKVQDIKFKPYSYVDMDYSILPEKLDLSKVVVGSRHRLYVFRNCDFSHVKEIKFDEDVQEIKFINVKGLPKTMDLSSFTKVSFNDTDLSKVKEIKYNEKAVLSLQFGRGAVDYFPEVLDLSQVSSVIIKSYSEQSPKQIKFKDGAEVDVLLATYPDVLDFSKCGKVAFNDYNVSKINKLIFRDRAQRDEVFSHIKSEYSIDALMKKCEFAISLISEVMGRFNKGKGE